jgi:hypothetical protein
MKRYLFPCTLALVLACPSIAQDQPKPETAANPGNTQQPTAAPPAKESAKPAAPPSANAPRPNATAPASTNAQQPTPETEKGTMSNLGTDVDAVRQRIENALASEPSLKGTAFTLNVSDDTIEISGVANNGRERTAARRIVQSFSGNLRVKDRMTVAGVAAPSADEQNPSRAKTADPNQAQDPSETLAKPESDEQPPAPGKKPNKPKKEPAKDGDKSEDPRKKSS